MSKNSAAGDHFFSLSAYGFKVAAHEQIDGFTMMSIPRIAAKSMATSNDNALEDEQILSDRGKDFILWKASSS